MKTQNTVLHLKKSSITELQNSDLANVKGGNVTTLGCFLCINSSNGPGTEYLQDQFKQL